MLCSILAKRRNRITSESQVSVNLIFLGFSTTVYVTPVRKRKLNSYCLPSALIHLVRVKVENSFVTLLWISRGALMEWEMTELLHHVWRCLDGQMCVHKKVHDAAEKLQMLLWLIGGTEATSHVRYKTRSILSRRITILKPFQYWNLVCNKNDTSWCDWILRCSVLCTTVQRDGRKILKWVHEVLKLQNCVGFRTHRAVGKYYTIAQMPRTRVTNEARNEQG